MLVSAFIVCTHAGPLISLIEFARHIRRISSTWFLYALFVFLSSVPSLSILPHWCPQKCGTWPFGTFSRHLYSLVTHLIHQTHYWNGSSWSLTHDTELCFSHAQFCFCLKLLWPSDRLFSEHYNVYDPWFRSYSVNMCLDQVPVPAKKCVSHHISSGNAYGLSIIPLSLVFVKYRLILSIVCLCVVLGVWCKLGAFDACVCQIWSLGLSLEVKLVPISWVLPWYVMRQTVFIPVQYLAWDLACLWA